MGGARETAGLTTRLILAYVRRRSGEAGVTRLLELAGETRSVDELEDERAWGTYAAKVALFEAAARVTDDPYVARRVGEAVLSERIAGTLRLAVGALGSPRQVLRSVAAAHVKFSTVAEMRTVTVRRNHALVAYRLQPGYEPSRHDCRYTQGLLTQVPVLFDLPPARLHHTVCQVDGAAECRYELVWQARRPWWTRPLRRRGATTERNAAVLQGHVLDLERSVAELVSARDVEVVLCGVAERASTAVRAQRHLLAVRTDGGAATMLGLGRLTLRRADGRCADTDRPARSDADPRGARRRPGDALARSAYDDPFLDALHDRLDGAAMALQPIVMRGELFGVLVGSWRTGEPHPVRCAELFRGLGSLAEQVAVALGNIRLLATIRHQATHDTLTGLAGRSLLLDRTRQALASAECTDVVTGMCFLDLDGFKDVNDRFGHAAGDAVLEELAAAARGRRAMYLAKVAGTGPRLGAPARSARR